MCQRHGLKVQIIETPWGQGAPLAAIEAALKADTKGEIKAVLATQNQTATGVRSDIGGIRKAMDAAKHGALLMVDGVSSIGSMPFEMGAWRRSGGCGQPKGLYAAGWSVHRGRERQGAGGDGHRHPAPHLL